MTKTKWMAGMIALLASWFSNPAEATWIALQGSLSVQATLTKVADNTYDFAYQWYFSAILPPGGWPQGGYDPAIGGYVYYYPYDAGATSVMLGDFGDATDLSGHGVGEYSNEYFSVYTNGAFRMTRAPSGVLSLSAAEPIITETWYPQPDGNWDFGGRDWVGEITGDTHLIGQVPATVGEQASWEVIPEPASWMLAAMVFLGIGLARWARMRRDRRAEGAIASAVAWAITMAIAVPAVGQAQSNSIPSAPITADDAVHIALEQNPSLLSSAEDVTAASGSKLQARSALLPNLNAQVGWSIADQANASLQGNQIVFDSQTTSGSVDLSQNLINISAWNRNKSAGKLEEAARYGYQSSRADIAIATYRQFYATLKQMKLHIVSLQALALTRDQLRRTQTLFDLGSVARGDVLKQQLQVSRAELEEITARRLTSVETARLSALLGLGAETPIHIDTTLTAGTLDVDSAAVMRDAIQNRPELANLRSRQESAGADVAAAKALRYPSLFARGTYDFSTPGLISDVRDIDRTAIWRGGVGIGIPIFDGFSAKGQIREARAREAQVGYSLRREELDVIVEVEEAIQLASQAHERIRVTTDALAVAEEDLKFSEETYNLGSGTVINLIDAQVALTRARSEYVSALADFRYALANLRRARGERF